MRVEANAKINLSLDVIGKRSDGYHELNMVMVPLTLCDYLDIEINDEDFLICKESMLPMDENNTIVKALALMRSTYQIQEHFRIHLEKHIPMQAGLAGGSADAAAVMRALCQILDLNVSKKELSMLSKAVGADVPFCVQNQCALVKGIGEQVEPFDMNSDFDILLVKPEQGVPTGKAFRMLDYNACAHPDAEKMKNSCVQGDFQGICDALGNSLEYSAVVLVPEIQSIKQELKGFGFEGVLMSGSGSTVFGLTRDKERLHRAYRYFEKQNVFVTETEILRKK